MSWEEELIQKYEEGETAPEELVRKGGIAYAYIKKEFPEYFGGVTDSIVWDKERESNRPHNSQDKKIAPHINATDRQLDGIVYRLKGRVGKVLKKHPRWKIRTDTDRDNGGQAILLYNTRGKLAKIIT